MSLLELPELGVVAACRNESEVLPPLLIRQQTE